MEYHKIVSLKNGKKATLRNGIESDGFDVMTSFRIMHSETDYLLSYPDENTIDAQKEGKFLSKMAESPNEIEILAIVDGKVVGLAGLNAIGGRAKIRHRSEMGVSILRDYWGLGLGRELTCAIIECARKAGYEQLELSVVADNERAISLYKKAGFVEFSRNPRGFKSRTKGYQELVSMRLELV